MLATAKPSGPKNSWLAYAALYRDPLGYLTRAARKHGDVVQLKIGRKSDFLLNRPDLVRAALLDHENLRRCVNRPLRRLLGTGLLTCRSERHKQQRALLQPIFTRERIVALGDVMVSQTTSWAKKWRDGATVDMAEEMTELAISITAKALFNVDLSSKSAELRDTLATLLRATRFKNLVVTSKQFEKLSLPFHRRFARAEEKLDTEIDAMIAERQNGGPRNDCHRTDVDVVFAFGKLRGGEEVIQRSGSCTARSAAVRARLRSPAVHPHGVRRIDAIVSAHLADDPAGSARCEDKRFGNPQRLVRAS